MFMYYFLDFWYEIKEAFKPSPYNFERKMLAQRGFKTLGIHRVGDDKYVNIEPNTISYYFVINSTSSGLPIAKQKWNNTGPTEVRKSGYVEYSWKYGNSGDTLDITDKVALWAETRGMDYERLTETERLQFSIDFQNLNNRNLTIK